MGLKKSFVKFLCSDTQTLSATWRSWAAAGQSWSLEMRCMALTARLLLGPIMGLLKLWSAKVPDLCKVGYILWYKHKPSVWGHRWRVGPTKGRLCLLGAPPKRDCGNDFTFPASVCQSLGLQSKYQWCLFMYRSQRLVSFFGPFAHHRYSSPTGNQTPLFSDQHDRSNPCPHAAALCLSLLASMGAPEALAKTAAAVSVVILRPLVLSYRGLRWPFINSLCYYLRNRSL